ncbi:MAG TPA: hypothetical protein VEJ89_07235 [Myxococcaceae bacterium]|nr:hypothetical protein [Myxococcaceae bacterium]
MNVIIRPVNDRFLEEVAFPAFSLGVVDAGAGLARLLQGVADLRTRWLVERVLERTVGGSFFGLDDDDWLEALHRVLFAEWQLVDEGWTLVAEHPGYAGNYGHALHAALMLQEPAYPYWDRAAAETFQNDWLGRVIRSGLVALVAGIWDPFPAFPPDQVLVTVGQSTYRPVDNAAVADWSFRSSHAVSAWGRRLPEQVQALAAREQRRLGKVEIPEAHELVGHWLGRIHDPPALTVAFSGLGADAQAWVREVGQLARQIREASQKGFGLTTLLTREGGTMAPLE